MRHACYCSAACTKCARFTVLGSGASQGADARGFHRLLRGWGPGPLRPGAQTLRRAALRCTTIAQCSSAHVARFIQTPSTAHFGFASSDAGPERSDVISATVHNGSMAMSDSDQAHAHCLRHVRNASQGMRKRTGANKSESTFYGAGQKQPRSLPLKFSVS
jgi:hypothetical protein